MMTSWILKSVDFTKTQKSRYLEGETLLILQIKKFINYRLMATYWKNSFVAEVTFNTNTYAPQFELSVPQSNKSETSSLGASEYDHVNSHNSASPTYDPTGLHTNHLISNY